MTNCEGLSIRRKWAACFIERKHLLEGYGAFWCRILYSQMISVKLSIHVLCCLKTGTKNLRWMVTPSREMTAFLIFAFLNAFNC